MSEDQFTKLFTYMTKRFDELDAKIDTKADRDRLEDIYTLLDGIAQRLDIDDQERLATNHQLDRQHGWIAQLAKHAKTKLVPEP